MWLSGGDKQYRIVRAPIYVICVVVASCEDNDGYYISVILYYVILYYIILYYIMLYYIILYCIILYYIVLYYIILYYIILYYIILYYIILYYIILYYIILLYTCNRGSVVRSLLYVTRVDVTTLHPRTP